MYINDLHVLHTMKPLSRLNLSINTRYEIHLCTKLVYMYIWLQILCKGAYICLNSHDKIFAEFEEKHYSLEWQAEMIV